MRSHAPACRVCQSSAIRTCCEECPSSTAIRSRVVISLHPPGAGVHLSDGGDRLVQPLCLVLGSLGHAGYQLVFGGAGSRLASGQTRDFQQRSRGAVYQRGVYEPAQSRRYSHQLRWPRTSLRQYFCGALMAQCEI